MESFIATLKYEEILVFTPGDVEYERSVATSNLLYRYSRPHCVVQPKRASQVKTVVVEANKRKLLITIKNGGHSYAGFSTAGTGISLDLSKMNTATLSEDEKTITLQGGCLWGHAYKQLINRHKDTFVINGGRCPTVGVSGFLLGGGLGPFSRSLGMGCDSLQEISLVTADGELVTVNKDDDVNSDKGKLFWALRGGGGGNFGVVVELKMPVQNLSGKEVVAGVFYWTPEGEVLKDFNNTMNKFYTTNWPNNTTIDSSWRITDKDKLHVRFLVYHDGDETGFDETINQHITDSNLREKMKQRTLPEASTRFLHETLVVQWKEETIKAFPENRKFQLFTSFVFKNDEKTIKTVTPIIYDHLEKFKSKFSPGPEPSPEPILLQVSWIHGGGKISEKPSTATAFPWREGVYFTYIEMEWEQKYLEKDMRDFLKEMKDKLRPHSLNKAAAYVNFADPGFLPAEYGNAYYGSDNYRKLQEVKDRWDKNDFFKWNQGVKPTNAPEPAPVKDHNETDELQKKQFGGFEAGNLSGTTYPGLNGVSAVGALSGTPNPIGLCDLGF